jgi:hypothetical protein
MKYLALLLFLLLGTSALGQNSKRANIKIINASIRTGTLIVNCNLNLLEADRSKTQFLLFFLKNNNEPLKLRSILSSNRLNYLIVDASQSTYEISISIPQPLNENYKLYSIVLEGEEYQLKRAIYLTSGEFYKINDVIDIFYRGGLAPLTYAEFN